MQETSFRTRTRGPRLKMLARLLLVLTVLAVGTALTWGVLAHTQFSVHAAPTQASGIVETLLPGYEPWGLTQDHAGHIWVAEPECDPGTISGQPFCSRTVQGKLIEYAATGFVPNAQPLRIASEPANYSSPFFVVADASANLWFTEPVTDALGELDHLGNWHQWILSTPHANPFDLTIDHTGHLWFTEPGVSAIGEFDPLTRRFTSTSTPSANSYPYGIAGPDPQSGSIWFTENNNQVHRIGRFTPGPNGLSGQMHEYLAPATNNNTPHLITFDNRGNIWWSEGWSGNLGRLTIKQAVEKTSSGISEYHVPSPSCPAQSNCGVHISGIAAASNGTIWFDDSLSSRVGSYTPGIGFALYTLAGSVSSGAHPHDGLIVDRAGHAWLSEEFANHLLEIVPPLPAVLKPAPTIPSDAY